MWFPARQGQVSSPSFFLVRTMQLYPFFTNWVRIWSTPPETIKRISPHLQAWNLNPSLTLLTRNAGQCDLVTKEGFGRFCSVSLAWSLGITETAGAAGPQENVAKQNGRLFHVSQTRCSIKKIRKCKFKRPIISRTLPIFSHTGPWWSMAPWWSHHGYHTGTKLITSMTCWELNPPCRT